MNQKLPTPLRNALARQAGGEVHPSPDVLTSFMERSLPGDEREVVTHHLALCAECRELVFLASNATEDVMEDEKELVALVKTPRRRWTLGMSWAVASVVALLVSSVVLLQRFGSENSDHHSVSMTVRNSQPPVVAQPAAPTMPSATAALPKTAQPETAPVKIASTKSAGAVIGGTLALKGGQQYPSEPRPAPASANESAQILPSSEGGPKHTAPLLGTHNSIVESQADTLPQLQQSADMAKPLVTMRAFTTPRGQWRISPDGHVERLVTADEWTRVLANETTSFHVVSVVGSDVWVGGDDGALFRSHDGGQHWSRVPLVSSLGTETGTIVSIKFNDPQQGIVLTSGGSQWTTSNGGATWTSK
jgi:Photosynthesis system II assembly factor YCF48